METTTFTPRLEKIRKVSRVFRLMCSLLFMLMLLFLMGGPLYLLAYRPGAGAVTPDLYSIGNQVIGLVTFAYWTTGLWMMVRLFGVFAAGRIFVPDSGRWLKRIGFWLATALPVPIALRMALDMAVYGALGAIREAPLAPVGGAALIGVFVVMLGWILEEGVALQEEQNLTV